MNGPSVRIAEHPQLTLTLKGVLRVSSIEVNEIFAVDFNKTRISPLQHWRSDHFYYEIWIETLQFNIKKSVNVSLSNTEKQNVQEKVVLYAGAELQVISWDVSYLSVKQNMHLWFTINNNNNVITSLHSFYCNLFILQNLAMKIKKLFGHEFTVMAYIHSYFMQTNSPIPSYRALCV